MNLTMPALPTVPVPVRRAAWSEIRRISTRRSGWVLVAVCGAIGLVTTLLSAQVGSGPQSSGQIATGTATVGLYLALLVAIVASAVTGALSTGAEYRYESMPLTALFIPDRDVLFGAKLGVAAAYSLLLGLSAEIGAALGLAALGRDKIQFGPQLVGAFGGGLLAAVCWGVIGASLGLLVRSTAIAVTAVIGWCIVAEPLIWLVARGVGIPGFAVLLPDSATIGAVAVGSFSRSPFFAPSAASAVVLILWTAAAGFAAWWYLRKREF
ncbi:ABC-2 type transport system permease protein [Nocardia sp. GAS34]|uniref:ABC transporter permease n=1 Tax=unclassified Nocardia TaxID=2637762 RepID=UPI003D248A06